MRYGSYNHSKRTFVSLLMDTMCGCMSSHFLIIVESPKRTQAAVGGYLGLKSLLVQMCAVMLNPV